MSAVGLAYYASFFCTIGKTERGCLLARVALSVAEMFNAKEWIGRVLCVKTALVDAWKVSPRELNGAFATACQSCFETGDIEVEDTHGISLLSLINGLANTAFPHRCLFFSLPS